MLPTYIRQYQRRKFFAANQSSTLFALIGKTRFITSEAQSKNNHQKSKTALKIWEYKSVKRNAAKGDREETLFIPCKQTDQQNGVSSSWIWTPVKNPGKALHNDQDQNHSMERNEKDSNANSSIELKQQAQKLIAHVLPEGYPHSVPPTYLSFSIYNFIASSSSSVAMVLSTQTLLHAMGLSSQTAAPMSAALNWVMKDGIGQLGGILFASRVGTSARGLDAYPKQWRMISSLSLDAATFIEIITPLFPYSYFLPLASLANIGKNISFLSASASRAVLHQNLAMKGNLADVTAKAGSQSIFASLVGTAVGVCISPFLITGQEYYSSSALFVTFAILSIVHQGGTYMSLKYVPMTNFNRLRLHFVMQHFVQNLPELETFSHPLADPHESTENKSSTSSKCNLEKTSSLLVLSPMEVARLEPILFQSSLTLKPTFSYLQSKNSQTAINWLKIGCCLQELCPNPDQFFDILLESEKYVLNYYASSDEQRNEDDDFIIRLVFLDDAEGIDIFRGILHAYITHSLLVERADMNTRKSEFKGKALKETSNEKFTEGFSLHMEDAPSLLKHAHKIMKGNFDFFEKELRKHGWKTDLDCESLEDFASSHNYLKITK